MPAADLDPDALLAVARAMGRDVPADRATDLAAVLRRMLADAQRLHGHPLGNTAPASTFRAGWE